MAAEDPGQEALLVLHDAVLSGDNAARVTLAELLLSAMRRRFANRRELDQHDIESIIGLSIASYLAAPDKYDRAGAPLLAYLYRDIDGDMRNEAAKRRRRPEVPAEEEILELRAPRGNQTMEDEVLERPIPGPASLSGTGGTGAGKGAKPRGPPDPAVARRGRAVNVRLRGAARDRTSAT